MARVYVSSTFQDLREARAAVRAAILRLGHQPIGMEDYGSDRRTVVAKCTTDVRNCDAFVLLLGRRYGWVPDGHEGRSITHLEYETACAADVEQMLFFHTEAEPRAGFLGFGRAEAERARAFRALICQRHTSKPFATVEALHSDVLADLNTAIGSHDPVPPALPYLCDRTPQRDALRDLAAVPALDVSRPFVWLLHGRFAQAHEQFLDRVRDELLADFASAPAGDVVHAVDVEWPRETDPAACVRRFEQRLAEALGARGHAAAADAAGAWPSALLVTSEVPFCRWDADATPRCLDAVVSRLAAWAPVHRTAPAVVVPWVRFDERDRKLADGVRASLTDLARRHAAGGRVALLPELDDVDFADVTAWARHPRVLGLLQQRRLPEQDLARALPATQRSPLDPVAQALSRILRERLRTPG